MWRLMTSDPASTGGLMDALTSGALGPAPWVSPQDEQIARSFRNGQLRAAPACAVSRSSSRLPGSACH
jgi:hypothetical protein